MGVLFVLPPGPSPVKNPRKLKGKQHTVHIILDRKRLLPPLRKIQAETHPLSCFLQRKHLDSIRGILSYSATEKRFFHNLKGRGPLKKVKNLRKCRGSKGLSMIPFTPPLLFNFTVPLKVRKNVNFFSPILNFVLFHCKANASCHSESLKLSLFGSLCVSLIQVGGLRNSGVGL
jgi:hypothetical protein